MKYHSRKIVLPALFRCRAFSLVEAVTALIILALISASVLVVVNRCMASAVDSTLRMRAFEVARENMEKLLSSQSVTEMVEYGSSDKYPEIQWQTTVEVFYDPLTVRMWLQGICSADYTDAAGEVQTIRLTHWLTDLTKEQLIQIIEEKKKEKEQSEAEPNEPKRPDEPNSPREPNLPAEPNRPQEKGPTDEYEELPFCERDLRKMSFEDLLKYIRECLHR